MFKNLCLLFALISTLGLGAQSNIHLAGWQLKRAGVNLGADQDMIHTMDYNYFLSTLAETPDYNYSNLNVTEEYSYGMLCENPHLRLSAIFQNPKIPQLEWGLSLVGIFGRIDEVSYATPNSNWGDEDWQYLRFTQTTNEVALESSLAYRLEAGAFALQGGLGANVGYLFDGYMDVYGDNINVCDNLVGFKDQSAGDEGCTVQEIYDYDIMRNGFSARAFAQVAASFTIAQRVELGYTFRYGRGARLINGADAVGTELHSNGLFVNWVFR